MIFIGILIGVVFVVCLILAYMIGYGVADQKYNLKENDE